MDQKKADIYQQRINCFRAMIANQQYTKNVEDELFIVSMNEGKTHSNAEARLSYQQMEYRKLYKQCMDIMKP